MHHHREGVHRVARQQDVQLHQRALAIAVQLVVERRVAVGAALELVVEVQDDLGQRQVVDHLLALLDRLHRDEDPAPVLAERHHRAHAVVGHQDRRADVGLLDALDRGRRREAGRRAHREDGPGGGGDPVLHVRRGRQQLQVVLALEALAHDVHVQQAEEPAAEAEAERRRGLGLVAQRGVVQREALEGVAQVRVVVGVRREEAAEDHRLDLAVARQGLRRRRLRQRQRVAHLQLAEVLQAGHQVAGLARREPPGGLIMAGDITPTSSASTTSLVCMACSRSPSAKAPSNTRTKATTPAVLVVDRVEDERAGRRQRIALGRGHARHDGLEHLVDPGAGLGRDAQHVLGVVADQLGERGGMALRVGRGQVDLVQHRHQVEVALDRQVGVGERLRLDALAGVDHQQRALARGQAARDLIAEVHVAGRVDQVELVGHPVARRVGHAHRLGLDRDAALALQVHRVEHLAAHVALG